MRLSWVRLELLLAHHGFDIPKILGSPLWASGSCCVSLLEKCYLHKKWLSMPRDIRRSLRKLGQSICLSGEMNSRALLSSTYPVVPLLCSQKSGWGLLLFSRSLSSHSPASGLCDFSIAYSSISFSSCIFL